MNPPARRLLIVNADDFGLTMGVSRGILRAHRDGIVTSTSALAVAPAFRESMTLLAAAPSLGVGVHLCAVGEDPPICPARSIPSLIDSRGFFPPNFAAFLLRAIRGAIRLDDLERELSAQVEAVLECTGSVTHLDSHQHLHLWPGFSEVALRIASRYGIRAIRVPRTSGRRLAGVAVAPLGLRLAARSRRAGVRFPAAAAGFDEAGKMTLPTLLATLERLAKTGAESVEVGTHPGDEDDAARSRYRWGYRWGEELEALVDPRSRAAVEGLGFTLGSFASLGA